MHTRTSLTASTNRNTLVVRATDIVEVAVLHDRARRVRGVRVPDSDRLIPEVAASPLQVLEGTVRDAVVPEHGGVWCDLDEVALGSVSRCRAKLFVCAVDRMRRLIGEVAVRDAVMMCTRCDVDVFPRKVSVEITLGDQVVAATHTD